MPEAAIPIPGYNAAMEIFGVLAASFGITYLLALGLELWAPRLGLMDSPAYRKPHARGTPIGGAALVAGVLVGFIPFVLRSPALWGWLAGALAVALLGTIDDRWHLRAEHKLLGQALAALVTVLGGGLIIRSVEIFGIEIALGMLAVPLTLLWIVGITNAFNLIDGLDGLAVGAALFISIATLVTSLQAGNSEALLPSLALIGASLAFLRFNSHPASLFLGDGASYFLGFTFALLTVAAPSRWEPLEGVPFMAPLVLLGYPILDTLWAIIRRLRAKRSIFEADREHIHHKLLAKWGYPATIRLFYGLFAVLAALSILASAAGGR
jgi:UDP-GlcNAc:undecaprenyl-phosphate GlcNAc-1-phosphate transferase